MMRDCTSRRILLLLVLFTTCFRDGEAFAAYTLPAISSSRRARSLIPTKSWVGGQPETRRPCRCHELTTTTTTTTSAAAASSAAAAAAVATRLMAVTRRESSELSVSTSSAADNVDLTPLAFGTPPETVLASIPFETSPSLDTSSNDSDLSSISSSSSSSSRSSATMTMPSSVSLPLLDLALAGSLTTLIADICMHPIDCIKTLQQSDEGLDYSVIQAAAALWETSGILGFYHGFLTYAVADSTGGALKFAVWELWKRSTGTWTHAGPVPIPSWITLWIGAGLAFVASSVFIVPGELIKQQLQMSHYDGLMEAVTGIYAAHGLSGFFVGYEGVLYRDIPYTMLELGLYEIFKGLLDARRKPDEAPKQYEQVLAAAVTGGITAFVTTPIDVVKTKLMVDSEYLDDSFFQCLVASIQNHGWPSVFAGVWARIGWILPFTAIYLPTYDFLKLQLWKRHEQQQNQASHNHIDDTVIIAKESSDS